MLDRKLIRENPEFVRLQAARKHISAPVEEFLEVDTRYRTNKAELDKANGESNQIAKSIGALMAQGKKDEAEQAKGQTTALKAKVRELEERDRFMEAELRAVELRFPNLPHATAPDCKDETENVTCREWGTKAEASKPHWEIATELGIIDFDRASKISGTGFAVYVGQGAKLVRSLISFMADLQVRDNGYTEVYPPCLISSQSLEGTGNLPKFADDLYKCEGDDLWLAPTAEVPVTNLLRDEILDASVLPVKLAAYTPCFRREAGSAGRETRGILRTHQFDKVELVKFVHPDTSYDELESLVTDAEDVLQALGLAYRVLELCTGDMGDKPCKIYDLEVWAPGVGSYLEVSSCSNFEAFQARRSGIRYRKEQGAPPEFVHILNGSGLAFPRLFAALVESNYKEGVVTIPEALRPYTGFESISRQARALP